MTTPNRQPSRLESFRTFMADPIAFPPQFKSWLVQYLLIDQPPFQINQLVGYKARTAGVSTQTPGAVAIVNIAHGLGITPAGYNVDAGNVNARGAPAVHLTADATNVILNFAGNLTPATSYVWVWQAQAP